ncbi:hypothetical protein CPB85DRAFT_318924 [Mucidula mucida]|nr:hypothetical protein CPB85DRAFT_318924 [Mucidula mucida]
MCHNIIDGRYHTECGHFYAMATRQQDCLRDNCVFSARHTHPRCRAATCIRLMALPVRNPIRVSPTKCSDCRNIFGRLQGSTQQR